MILEIHLSLPSLPLPRWFTLSLPSFSFFYPPFSTSLFKLLQFFHCFIVFFFFFSCFLSFNLCGKFYLWTRSIENIFFNAPSWRCCRFLSLFFFSSFFYFFFFLSLPLPSRFPPCFSIPFHNLPLWPLFPPPRLSHHHSHQRLLYHLLENKNTKFWGTRSELYNHVPN